MKVLAITNQKGGVAKTTTAVNLMHRFALDGLRVLGLDMDGQGHVAPLFRLKKSNGLQRLLMQREPLRQVVDQAREGVDIVTNDHTSETLMAWAQGVSFREFLVATVLDQADGSYDVVIIDTPPSTNLLHVAALVAADYVLIPAVMDYLAIDGIGHVFATLRDMGRFPNVIPPRLIGIVPTKFERPTTRETKNNIRQLQEQIGSTLILPPIPSDTKVREAASMGETIWEYAPGSQAAVGYEDRGAKAVNKTGNVGGYQHLAEITRGVMGI